MGYGSSLGVDIDHFSSKLTANMHFGENREEIRTGSEESPEPVYVDTIGLYEIFQVLQRNLNKNASSYQYVVLGNNQLCLEAIIRAWRSS